MKPPSRDGGHLVRFRPQQFVVGPSMKPPSGDSGHSTLPDFYWWSRLLGHNEAAGWPGDPHGLTPDWFSPVKTALRFIRRACQAGRASVMFQSSMRLLAGALDSYVIDSGEEDTHLVLDLDCA